MPTIHRFTDDAVPVNAYLVETADAVVAVDGTLTVQGGRGLRARLDRLGKPLAGVLMTHSHPDHYGGLVELLAGADAPVFATAGVAAVIERDDPVKEQILRPMFGAACPPQRRFPDRRVAAGETIALGGASFTVVDLGPGESPHDSVWLLDAPGAPVFAGDQAYNGMHAYLSDGFHAQWLANIERLKADLPAEATLYVGHGEPGGLELSTARRATSKPSWRRCAPPTGASRRPHSRRWSKPCCASFPGRPALPHGAQRRARGSGPDGALTSGCTPSSCACSIAQWQRSTSGSPRLSPSSVRRYSTCWAAPGRRRCG